MLSVKDVSVKDVSVKDAYAFGPKPEIINNDVT